MASGEDDVPAVGRSIGEVEGRAIGRRELAVVAGIFAVAAALRVGYVLSVADDPSVRFPMVDSRAYHERAVQILGGQWSTDRVAYQDPLYPYFLALLYAVFGVGAKAVLVAQALLDAATVLGVYAIARRLFGFGPAAAAASIAALYEVFFFFDAFLLKLPLSVFLVTAALAVLVHADVSGRARSWAAGGAVFALACLTRGNYLVFVPVAGVFALVGVDRLEPRRAIAYTLGLAGVLLPVASYNAVVAGDLVLVTSQAGQNFYIGNHRGNDTGRYKAPSFVRPNPAYEEADFRAEAERRTGRAMRPSELSRFWFGEGWREIAQDPSHFASHLLTRAGLYFGHYEVPDNQSYDYFVAEVSSLLRLPLPTYGAVLPIALCGMGVARRRRAAWIPISFFVAYSASVLLFFNMARYRVPIVPVLCVFAGVALVRAAGWLRDRRWRPLAAMALFLGVAYPIVYRDLVEPDFAITHYNVGVRHLGAAERERNRIPALVAAGDEVGAAAARDAVAASMDLAARDLARALDLQPDSPRRRNQLARLMLTIALDREARGDTDGALAQARETTARFPRFAEAFALRGRLEAGRGEPGAARASWQRALSLQPGHAAAAAGLERLDGGSP